MAQLRYLWVVHTTSTAENADTEDAFTLVIYSPINPQAEVGSLSFPDLPHDERERGRTDQYRFDMRREDVEVNMFGLSEGEFALQTNGRDAWLPASIWIIGQDIRGVRSLLVDLPNWPNDLWFSRDSSEGAGLRRLDEPFRLIN